MNSHVRGELQLARVLYPELASSLDAALARHGAAHGAALGEGSSGASNAVAEFEAGLDSVVGERFAGAGFGDLARTEGGARLIAAFDAARVVATWAVEAGIDLKVPEPETFAAAGLELAHLAEILREGDGLTPVPAPYGLGPKAWSALFERAAFELAADQQNSQFSAEKPLLLASEVTREFDVLDDPSHALASETHPLASESETGSTPRRGASQSGAVTDGRITWALRLIPATPSPPTLGLNFTNCGPHVTLPEMLMLQAMRAAAGQPPLDGGDGRSSFTWLAGKIGDGRLAARHVYDASDRALRITAREIGSQGPHLGARQPVS